MNCVSGVAFKNLVIKQNESVFSIEYIMPGLFYVCFYDDERYFGVANYVLVENCHVNIKFFHPNGLVAQLLGLVLKIFTAGSQYMISLQK